MLTQLIWISMHDGPIHRLIEFPLSKPISLFDVLFFLDLLKTLPILVWIRQYWELVLFPEMMLIYHLNINQLIAK